MLVSTLLADLTGRCVQPAMLFVLFLCGVSPILYTLTESISTDTVWAMTVSIKFSKHFFFVFFFAFACLLCMCCELEVNTWAIWCAREQALICV